MPIARINGTDINFSWEGDDSLPVLILSNSLTTSLSLWDEQVSTFVEHFRVLRYDNRGHGLSSSSLGEYSLEDIAGDLLALMDLESVSKASLCGISLGGMVGMWFGINASDRIEKLVLSNTSSDLRPPNLWQARIDTVLERGMTAIIDGALERFLTEPFRISGSEKIDLLKSMITSCDPEGYSGCCAAVRDMNLTSQLNQITNPTLIIAGESDASTPVSHSKLIHQEIKGSKLHVIDRVAHLSNIEKPQEFNNTVLKFLLE